MKKISRTVKTILLEHLNERIDYYTDRLIAGITIQVLVRESLEHKEFNILHYLIKNKFPEYSNYINKMLLLR